MAQQSKKSKKFFHMVYSIGASIVILGAMFKILHIGFWIFTGDSLLMAGLITEALVFFLSAFEPVEEDLDWSKVYPELAGGSARKRKDKTDQDIETKLSEKLDKMLKEANLDSELMKSLGESITKLHKAAKSMDVAVDAADSTKRYAEELSIASTQLESLNSLYKVQMESTNKHAVANETAAAQVEELKERMTVLKQNMSSLNDIYGGMLSAMKVGK